MTLISNITLYPPDLRDFRLDARSSSGMPFMLVAFNYTRESETNAELNESIDIVAPIAKQAGLSFEELLAVMEDLSDMEIKPVSVRKYLTTRHETTTIFQPKISLS